MAFGPEIITIIIIIWVRVEISNMLAHCVVCHSHKIELNSCISESDPRLSSSVFKKKKYCFPYVLLLFARMYLSSCDYTVGCPGLLNYLRQHVESFLFLISYALHSFRMHSRRQISPSGTISCRSFEFLSLLDK